MNDNEVDDLLRGLKAAPPLPPPPAIPISLPWYRRRSTMAAVALAAVVLLAVGLPQLLPSERVGVRGDNTETVSTLTLSISAVRGGQTVRVGAAAAVGEPLYFRLSATPATPVVLAVEGPSGREVIADTQATDVETLLQGASGTIGYIADVPGAYTFSLEGGGATEQLRLQIN